MVIDGLSDDYFDDYSKQPATEERVKWLDVGSEELVTNTFKNLAILPMMSRCSKVDFEAYVQDRYGNQAGIKVHVEAEKERPSGSDKPSPSKK